MSIYQIDFAADKKRLQIVEITYEDGLTEMQAFPAQIWRLNDAEVSRTFTTKKAIRKITIDPKLKQPILM